MTIELHVLGIPAPQGSKRGFVVGKQGGPQRAVVVEGGSKAGREKVASWRQDVIDTCRAYMTAHPYDPPLPMAGALQVRIEFRLPKPKSVPKSRYWPMVRPDLDKLTRSTLDAMTLSGLIGDDAQVCWLDVSKRYAEVVSTPPGAHIFVRTLT